MGKSSIATLVSVQLANDIANMLDRRAKARGLSRSRYAAMIFEKWRDDKFPALDTVDSTARAVVKQQLDKEKSFVANPQVQGKLPASEVRRQTALEAVELSTTIVKATAKKLGKTKPKTRAA